MWIGRYLILEMLAAILLLGLSGCGSSNSGNNNGNNGNGGSGSQPTPTGITGTATPSEIPAGGMSQIAIQETFSSGAPANLQPNQITFTVPNGQGNVNASTGVYSGFSPAQKTQVTIGASYGGFAAQITVTVDAAQPPAMLSLTKVLPAHFTLDGYALIGSVLYDANCQSGDTLTITIDTSDNEPLNCSQNPFSVVLNFVNHWDFGWVTFTGYRGSQPSNTLFMGAEGYMNTLAIDSDGELINSETGKNEIYLFHFDSESGHYVLDNSFPTSVIMASTVDTTSHEILLSQGSGACIVAYNRSGQFLTAFGNASDPCGSIAAVDKTVCALEPGNNKAHCDPDITNWQSQEVVIATHGDPHNLVMEDLNGEKELWVFSRGDSEVCGYNALTGALIGCTPQIPGLATQYNTGFQMVLTGTTTGALLDQTNGILVPLDLAGFTAGNPIPLTNLVFNGQPFPGDAFRIDSAQDGTVKVAFDDPAAGLTRNVSVDLGTGIVTPLTATSENLAVGYRVTTNGLAFCMRGQCDGMPAQ